MPGRQAAQKIIIAVANENLMQLCPYFVLTTRFYGVIIKKVNGCILFFMPLLSAFKPDVGRGGNSEQKRKMAFFNSAFDQRTSADTYRACSKLRSKSVFICGHSDKGCLRTGRVSD